MKHLIFKGITPYLFAFIALFSLQTVCGKVSIAKTSTVETALCSQCGDDGDADFYEGRAYEKKKDYYKAFRCYMSAAEVGHSDAQARVGYFYQKGLGVTKDFSEAVYWYQMAVDQDNPYAQLQLGICYYYAMGVEKDINMALYLYELSADNGNMEAQYRLARCYRYGIAGRHDVNKAIKLYAKAAAQGHAKAAKELDEWNF